MACSGNAALYRPNGALGNRAVSLVYRALKKSRRLSAISWLSFGLLLPRLGLHKYTGIHAIAIGEVVAASHSCIHTGSAHVEPYPTTVMLIASLMGFETKRRPLWSART